jgi:hypothetical protein
LTAEDVGEPTEQVSRIVTCLVRELIRARNGAGITQQEQTPPALLWARATAKAPDY